MAKTFTAPFAQTPKSEANACTSAVASLSGNTPTNTVELLTAGSDGAMITSISGMTRATNSAMALYLFISVNSGSDKTLMSSTLMEAHTVAATTAIPVYEFTHPDGTAISEERPLRLEASAELWVGIGASGNVVFQAQMTDF